MAKLSYSPRRSPTPGDDAVKTPSLPSNTNLKHGDEHSLNNRASLPSADDGLGQVE